MNHSRSKTVLDQAILLKFPLVMSSEDSHVCFALLPPQGSLCSCYAPSGTIEALPGEPFSHIPQLSGPRLVRGEAGLSWKLIEVLQRCPLNKQNLVWAGHRFSAAARTMAKKSHDVGSCGTGLVDHCTEKCPERSPTRPPCRR